MSQVGREIVWAGWVKVRGDMSERIMSRGKCLTLAIAQAAYVLKTTSWFYHFINIILINAHSSSVFVTDAFYFVSTIISSYQVTATVAVWQQPVSHNPCNNDTKLQTKKHRQLTSIHLQAADVLMLIACASLFVTLYHYYKDYGKLAIAINFHNTLTIEVHEIIHWKYPTEY